MSVSQEPLLYEPKLYIFDPPADPNIPGSEVRISLFLKRSLLNLFYLLIILLYLDITRHKHCFDNIPP